MYFARWPKVTLEAGPQYMLDPIASIPPLRDAETPVSQFHRRELQFLKNRLNRIHGDSMKTDHQPPEDKNPRPITRRRFLTGVGAGAVGVAASRQLAAAGAAAEKTELMEPDEPGKIVLKVNGHDHHVLVEPRWTLLFVLREKLGLTGTKESCGRGECGACTVLIDDIPRYACLTLAVEAEGAAVTTVEGLMEGEDLGPVQSAFVEEDAFQCGYCTPGQIVSVEGLLRKNPQPSVGEIRTAVSGNLCRCGAYTHIFKAAARAAGDRRG